MLAEAIAPVPTTRRRPLRRSPFVFWPVDAMTGNVAIVIWPAVGRCCRSEHEARTQRQDQRSHQTPSQDARLRHAAVKESKRRKVDLSRKRAWRAALHKLACFRITAVFRRPRLRRAEGLLHESARRIVTLPFGVELVRTWTCGRGAGGGQGESGRNRRDDDAAHGGPPCPADTRRQARPAAARIADLCSARLGPGHSRSA
jgi:hypothetical protein